VFLHPAGLLWLFFANRVKHKSNMFRKFVLGFHGFILVACALGIICLLFYPTEQNTTLTVYSKTLHVGQVGQIINIIIQAAIFAPPFIWLRNADVKKEFIQKSKRTHSVADSE
jgi:hypothetical protein